MWSRYRRPLQTPSRPGLRWGWRMAWPSEVLGCMGYGSCPASGRHTRIRTPIQVSIIRPIWKWSNLNQENNGLVFLCCPSVTRTLRSLQPPSSSSSREPWLFLSSRTARFRFQLHSRPNLSRLGWITRLRRQSPKFTTPLPSV